MKNVSNKHLDVAQAALQHAIELNPNNCEVYPILSNIYENLAIGQDGSSQKLDPALIEKAITVNQHGIQRCPDTISLLFSEYSLARDYSNLGNHGQAIIELNKLITANPVNVNYRTFVPANLYSDIGSEYESMGNRLDAFKAYLHSASYEADAGQTSDSIKTVNKDLKDDPNLAAQIGPGQPIGFGRYRSAAITPDGKVHLLATLYGNSALLLYTNSQNGQDWQNPQILMVHDGMVGSLVLDAQGVVHFAYSANGNTIVYANTKDGLDKAVIIDMKKTQPQLALNGPFSIYVSTLQIAIDSQDRAHIICGYSHSQIGYVMVSNGIPSVSKLIANDAINPDIGISSDGSLDIVYNNSNPFPEPGTQVWFINKVNEKWSTPIQLSEDREWAGAASIAVQTDGSIHVVYLTGSTADSIKLMYVHRNLDGRWSQPEMIGDGQFRPWIPPIGPNQSFGGRTAPSITLLSGNKLAVIWRAQGKTSTTVLGRVLQDGTWGPIKVIGQIDGQDYHDTQSIVLSQLISGSPLMILWPEAGKPVLHEWHP